MRSLKVFINEGKTAIDDLTKMLSSFTTAAEDKKQIPEISKKDIIVTAKLCSNLEQCTKLTHGRRYLYTEFDDNNLSKVAIISADEEWADVWDDKGFNSIVEDEFKKVFGYLLDGGEKDNIDMRIWRDKTSAIVGSGLL